jgi:hypothetical protein
VSRAHKLLEALAAHKQPGLIKAVNEIVGVDAATPWVRSAIKFDIGEIENIPSARSMFDTLETCRLPFDVCLFYWELCSNDGVRVWNYALCHQNEKGLLVANFQEYVPGGVFGFEGLARFYKGEPELTIQIPSLLFSVKEEVKRNFASTLHNLAAVLQALRCKNVYLRDNTPPEKLNKKRKQTGKVPFFSYKTLHLATGSKTVVRRDASEPDRNSPRLHFRRGHVRRLSSGELTWVSQCMVGDKNRGLVMKDYAVKD